jgi:hypothetical protein
MAFTWLSLIPPHQCSGLFALALLRLGRLLVFVLGPKAVNPGVVTGDGEGVGVVRNLRQIHRLRSGVLRAPLQIALVGVGLSHEASGSWAHKEAGAGHWRKELLRFNKRNKLGESNHHPHCRNNRYRNLHEPQTCSRLILGIVVLNAKQNDAQSSWKMICYSLVC